MSPPSVFGARDPVAESNIAIEEVASVESTTVTVDARVARSMVILFGTSASDMEAQVRLPLAPIVVAKVLAPQSVGLAASADAVEAFPVNPPTNEVAVIVSAPTSILPKPAVMLPESRTPTAVNAEIVSLASRRAASFPSNLANSAEDIVAPPTVISLDPIAKAVPIAEADKSIASPILEPTPVEVITRALPISPVVVLSIVNL